MPATRQKLEQGAHSRELLLDATSALLGERGYSAVSVDAITARAGVVRSAIYWHFGSKNGLILAALIRETQQWVSDVQAALVDAPTPVARLDCLMAHVRETISARPEGRRMVFSLLIERGHVDDELRLAIAQVFDAMRAALAQGFAEGTGAELARCKVIADAFVDMADGITLRFLAERDEARLDAALAELRKTVLMRLAHEMTTKRGRS